MVSAMAAVPAAAERSAAAAPLGSAEPGGLCSGLNTPRSLCSSHGRLWPLPRPLPVPIRSRRRLQGAGPPHTGRSCGRVAVPSARPARAAGAGGRHTCVPGCGPARLWRWLRAGLSALPAAVLLPWAPAIGTPVGSSREPARRFAPVPRGRAAAAAGTSACPARGGRCGQPRPGSALAAAAARAGPRVPGRVRSSCLAPLLTGGSLCGISLPGCLGGRAPRGNGGQRGAGSKAGAWHAWLLVPGSLREHGVAEGGTPFRI